MRHLLVAVLVAGCGPKAKPEPPDPMLNDRLATNFTAKCGAASSELSRALEPLAWLLGNWTSNKSDEHWIAAGGAIYGIAFDHKGGYDVMMIDDGDGPGKPDGKLRFIAVPAGAPESTQFELYDVVDGKKHGFAKAATFVNPQHDYPTQISYQQEPAGLGARVEGGDKMESFSWECADRDTRAEPLEEADRAFAADTAKRGIDGWIDAFARDGAMLRRGKRIEGADAIREVMAPLLASGKLAWEPIASGIDGNIGFTVGRATFTGTDPADRWKSTYVTIWRSRNDGPWKVVFDTGRVVNE